jgi:hypothetical protein
MPFGTVGRGGAGGGFLVLDRFSFGANVTRLDSTNVTGLNRDRDFGTDVTGLDRNFKNKLRPPFPEGNAIALFQGVTPFYLDTI